MSRAGRLEIVRSIDVCRTVEDVFAYVSDFTKAKEWRTEVTQSSMQPVGPMREGTRLHEVAVVAGWPVITESIIDAYEPPHRFTFAHLSGPMPVSGQYHVTDAGDGSRLTYTLQLRLTGLWRLLLPILRRTGPKTVGESLGQLAAHLESQVPQRAADLPTRALHRVVRPPTTSLEDSKATWSAPALAAWSNTHVLNPTRRRSASAPVRHLAEGRDRRGHPTAEISS